MRIGRKPETIAAGLTVAERVLLFCIASRTDWQKLLRIVFSGRALSMNIASAPAF
jgi:hypothetical protein